MRSELFEETLKQHKDALTGELVKLGNYRQAQLAEWDIEKNESDYEFYFNAAWDYQQSKVDELQKQLIDQGQRFNEQSQRVKDLEHKNGELQKQVDGLTQVMEGLLEEMKYPTATFEEVICSGVRELEQALKGGSDE